MSYFVRKVYFCPPGRLLTFAVADKFDDRIFFKVFFEVSRRKIFNNRKKTKKIKIELLNGEK